MPTVLMVNGKAETLFSARDFQHLVDTHMGFEAMRYFRELVDELDELRSENADLEKEVEELQAVEKEVEELRAKEGKRMYVYIKSESWLWTVGFYDPDGKWQPESDWGSSEEAASRVHYLNGGRDEC